MLGRIMQPTIYIFIIFACLLPSIVGAENSLYVKEIEDLVNSVKCQDGLYLNLSNSNIYNIHANFIKSPVLKCIDMKYNHIHIVEEDAFGSLPNLMYLNLSGNNINNTDLLSFGGYESLRILSIDDATTARQWDLRHVRVDKVYSELRYLSLRLNYICAISYMNKTAFENVTFQMCFDAPSALPALPKLEYLDLSYNAIFSIDLTPHERLKYVNLQNNLLMNIKAQSLTNLLVLNLADNSLSNITLDGDPIYSSSLNGLKNLRNLSLEHNIISQISPNAFSDMPQLVFLNLSHNKLEIIPPIILEQLSALQDLIIDYNQLEDVPRVTEKVNIRFLSLYKNKIKSIPGRIFSNMPLLEKLDLGLNGIENIDAEAFYDLQFLELLDLSNNNLESLPKNWCEPLKNLKFLDLSSNKFSQFELLSLTGNIPCNNRSITIIH